MSRDKEEREKRQYLITLRHGSRYSKPIHQSISGILWGFEEILYGFLSDLKSISFNLRDS